MHRNNSSRVPRNRRAHLGSLAGSVAGGMPAEGLRAKVDVRAILEPHLSGEVTRATV